MATPTADLYGAGVNDLSLLTGTQQDTARMIQKAFANSQARYQRDVARYPAFVQSSTPLLQESLEDQALARAGVTSNILNQNQQLQNLIDASHHTPHGLQQNLAAYLPWLGAGLQAYPALFGYPAAGRLGREGILPTLGRKASEVYHSFFDPTSGQEYHLDANGNLVGYGMQDRGLGTGGAYGSSYYGAPALPAVAQPGMDVNFPPPTGVTTTPYDFGTAPADAGSAFNFSAPEVSDIASWYG